EGLPLASLPGLVRRPGLHPPVAFNVERKKDTAFCGLAPHPLRIGRYKRTYGGGLRRTTCSLQAHVPKGCLLTARPQSTDSARVPRSTRITIRWLSILLTLRWQSSLRLKPAE